MPTGTEPLEGRKFIHEGRVIDPNFITGKDNIRIDPQSATALLPAGIRSLAAISSGILSEIQNYNWNITQASDVYVFGEPLPLVRSNTGPSLAISYPMQVRYAINDSNNLGGLIALARIYKLDYIADRLIEFSDIDEEEDQKPLLLNSVKLFLEFIIHNRQLFDPLIALCPDGNIQAEWHTKDNKHLAIKFLLNSKVRFSILTPSSALSSDNLGENLSGLTSIDKLSSTLQDFEVYKWKK